MIPESFLLKFNSHLESFVKEQYSSDSKTHHAIQYCLLNGGKRVRPFLTYQVGALFDSSGPMQKAFFQAGVAIELLHTYSLVHDDLPCMDDDDFRRGKATCHKRYGEPFALLAGDGMLTDSFHLLSKVNLPSHQVLGAIQCLSAASGSRGMVEGQTKDLESSFGLEKPTLKLVEKIHTLKTGHLLGASCSIGAILADADKKAQIDFYQFGLLIGLAFQIMDDILDNQDGTGKSKGKDLEQNKLTYLKFYSNKEAKELAAKITSKAQGLIGEYDGEKILKRFTDNLINRNL